MTRPAPPETPGGSVIDQQSTSVIAWRHLDRHLWVGIGPHGHVGTVEEGRRFVAVDTFGQVRCRCRTLEHAQAVLVAIAESGEVHAA